MTPSCVAIIPARGGSKGLPRKNVLDLAGAPLVAHAIRAALAAKRVDAVYVSTDDAEIAAVARHFGAGVIDRPAEIAGDAASSESAVLHALELLRARGGPVPELVMMIQCTSPLTTAEDLDGLVQQLEADAADSCFLAAPFHHFLWERDEDGAVRGVNHAGQKRKRRQELEPQYLENGAAYLMRREPFEATGERFCGRTTLHAVDPARTLEIDDPADFIKAEALVRHLQGRIQTSRLPRPLHALVMDFDGVFTDNAALVLEDGREAVRVDRGDGMGLGLLQAAGVPMVILSKERNPVVSARAGKLGIECYQSMDHKLVALEKWLAERKLDLAHTIYVGNDVNDLECMRAVGCAVAPADAHPSALRVADMILQRPGGHGALRELCDLVLAAMEQEGGSPR